MGTRGEVVALCGLGITMPVCTRSIDGSTIVVDNRHFGEEQLILHIDSYLDPVVSTPDAWFVFAVVALTNGLTNQGKSVL